MNKSELVRTVQNAQKGDNAAFEALYSEFYDKLYFFVLKNVGRKEAAEDITQDTFLKSMEKIRDLDKPETYSSWLHSIAFNKCKDLFRAENRNTYFDSDEEQEAAFENLSLNEPMMIPEDFATNKDRAKQLKAMIDSLKPDMKSALILYYYDDMSISQVAKTLKMNDNTVKQKLFQARKKLKAKIEQMQKQGVVLCAVPMGNVLKTAVTPKHAAAARAGAGAAVSGGIAGGKVAAAAAAMVMVVGIPLALHAMRNNDNDITGDTRTADSYADADISFVENSSLFETDDTSSEAAEEKTESKPDDTEAEKTDSKKETGSSEAEAKSGSTSSVTEITLGQLSNNDNSTNSKTDTQTINGSSNTSQASQDTSSQAEKTDSQPEEKKETQPVEMSVDKLLSTSVDDLLELSNEDFEPVQAAMAQSMSYGFRCKAFPEYVFIVGNDIGEGEPENDRELLHTMTDGSAVKITLRDDITQLNLYEGAVVGDGVTVGMRYNELKDILGQDLLVEGTGTSLGLATRATIGGREWILHFDLTEEQQQAIFDEFSTHYEYVKDEEGNDVLLGESAIGLTADLSEYDPVCDIAVLNLK